MCIYIYIYTHIFVVFIYFVFVYLFIRGAKGGSHYRCYDCLIIISVIDICMIIITISIIISIIISVIVTIIIIIIINITIIITIMCYCYHHYYLRRAKGVPRKGADKKDTKKTYSQTKKQ